MADARRGRRPRSAPARSPRETPRWYARAAVAVVAVVAVPACATAPLSATMAPSPSPNTSASLPNGLVDIGGGRHLEMYCRGSGRPAVILEAGLGNMADVWSAISTRVDSFTTVCA